MSGPTVDNKLIRELAALLEETGLSEIEWEHEGQRVRVAKHGGTYVAAPAPAVAPTADLNRVAPTDPPEQPVPEAAPVDHSSHPGAVTSPMVGTAYLSPEPDANPFIQAGDTVAEGQTLLIVEAMKTMNPIPAPRGGKVAHILVGNGAPVEYGEVLVIID